MNAEFVLNGNSFSSPTEILKWVEERRPFAPLWEQRHLDVISGWFNSGNEFLFHTSGTTGEPETRRFTRIQVEASAKLTAKTFGLKAGSRSLLVLPSEYVAGRMMIYRALINGWELQWTEPSSLPFNGELPPAQIISLTPHQTLTLLRRDPNALNTQQVVLVGGGAVNEVLGELLAGVPADVWETYGATETLTHIARRSWSKHRHDRGAWFQPLEGVSVSADDRGCLVIQASHLGSAEVFTNDVVELSDQGFRILGRADSMINSGGVKLFPERIEALLTGITEQPFCIIPQPHDLLGQQPWLVLEGQPLSSEEESALLNQCAQLVSRFERPGGISYLPVFPRTESGKIRRGLIQTN